MAAETEAGGGGGGGEEEEEEEEEGEEEERPAAKSGERGAMRLGRLLLRRSRLDNTLLAPPSFWSVSSLVLPITIEAARAWSRVGPDDPKCGASRVG